MKTSEPTKEEILEKNGFDFDQFEIDNEYSAKNLLSAMQEFAEAFHKEKLKNDLIYFASQRNEQHFLDWESKYMISVDEINDYINTK